MRTGLLWSVLILAGGLYGRVASATDARAPVRPVEASTSRQIEAPPPAAVSPSTVVNARDIATPQPGPHGGAGRTTASPFFAEATGLPLVFRQRALHKGATIGDHVNDKDEIYYVLSGRGELMLNGDVRDVGPGDAILTRNGDRHGLRQSGDEDLVILIVFDEDARTP